MMIYKSSNLWLFLVLSLNFWAAPLLPGDLASEVFTDGLIAATLVAALALQGYLHPQFRGWAFGAGAFVVAAVILEEVLPDTRYVENASFALCFAAVTVFYLNAMARTLREVTADTVFEAVIGLIYIAILVGAVIGAFSAGIVNR